MNIKSNILSVKIALFLLLNAFVTTSLTAQQTPLNPVSYRVFSPFIFNPAIAGSKDFSSIDVIAGKFDQSNSQIFSSSARLSKSSSGYFSSDKTPVFTNIGIGGSIFNELNGLYRNTGFSATGSYHKQLDKDALSFLSFGITGKAVYNQYSGNPDLSDSAKSVFLPNLDAGVYYYNKSFYAGLAVTNLFGSPKDADTADLYKIPVSRQLFFQVGYKLVLSKSLNILVEPSVIINSDDSFSGDISEMIEPMLKVYAGNFCLGTYFYDYDRYSFFFQYMYPKFYVATYFDIPRNTPFYKNPVRAEIAIGINISAIKYGSGRFNHW